MAVLSMAGMNVFLAMPMHRDLPAETARSLLETVVTLTRIGIPFTMEWQVGSSRVTAARSKAVHQFLKTECNRLFWLDSDMSWKPDDFLRLLALSSRLECVGGIYVPKRDPPQFQFNPGDPSHVESNEFGCLSIHGMGLGFTVVHRSLIETLAANALKVIFPDIEGPAARVFREDIDEQGRDRGEDMAFFADVRDLGFKVWLDPSIVLGHIGTKEYSADFTSILNKEITHAQGGSREVDREDAERAYERQA